LLIVAWTVVLLGGCSRGASDAGSVPVERSESRSSEAVPAAVSPLEDGPIAPGRYRYMLTNLCDDRPLDCPADGRPPPPLGIDVTVPAGWEAATEFHLIAPRTRATPGPSDAAGGPSEAGLVLGWTNFWVGLNSNPCTPIGTPGGHQRPDIPVGPTVGDFVDAVLAHPTLEVSEPTEVRLGGHAGMSFTLTAPSDLRGCDNWRPWDPGFYAQGPSNIWDVWAVDVDGFRVVVVAQHFPDTPAEVLAQLRDMAESIRFVP
jgi:hypothetical protein